MELEVNPKQKISLFTQDIIRSRELRKLNRLLEHLFEIGYDKSIEKWYWSALKETLLQTDEIINYVPLDFNEVDDVPYAQIAHLFEPDIELTDIEIYVDNDNESLSSKPVIECCWKLLDRFYQKIENRNLYYVKRGFLLVFCRICTEYKLNYD